MVILTIVIIPKLCGQQLSLVFNQMLARWRHCVIKSAKAWPYQFKNQPDKLKLEDELRNEVVSSSGDGLAIASLYSLKGVPSRNAI